MKINKAILHYDFLRDVEQLVIRTEGGYVSSLIIAHNSDPHHAIYPCIEEGSREFVQAIMDAGWKAGLKPAGYEDASRELSATKYHLEDMRELAKVKK